MADESEQRNWRVPGHGRGRASRRSIGPGRPLARRTLMMVAATRGEKLGLASRPVSVPADVDDPRVVKASGRVELPLHVRWSGEPKTYDLADRRDRVRVYEQMLRRGPTTTSATTSMSTTCSTSGTISCSHRTCVAPGPSGPVATGASTLRAEPAATADRRSRANSLT